MQQIFLKGKAVAGIFQLSLAGGCMDLLNCLYANNCIVSKPTPRNVNNGLMT